MHSLRKLFQLIAVLALTTGLFITVPRAHATGPGFIEVNTTADTLGDGLCSLPEAIKLVDGLAGSDVCARTGIGTPLIDTIRFNISSGPQTITLASALDITAPVSIQGNTQPGFNSTTHVPLIRLTTSGASLVSVDGSPASGTEIKYLQLTLGTGVGGYDIGTIAADSVTVQGCYLNTDGTAVLGNLAWGVELDSSNNTIGGPPGDGNLVGGSGGIRIDSGSGTLVQGNYFGVRADGVTPLTGLPNNDGAIESGFYGTATATGSVIRGNVITGFLHGIDLDADTNTNTIVGNYIGLGADGTTPLGNNWGISIGGSYSNTIGGTTAADRNVISGNVENIVFQDQTVGLVVHIPALNVINGNFIGTTADGMSCIGTCGAIYPDLIGIDLINGDRNTIGGTAAGSGNLVSGNATGIYVQTGVTLTTIQGNMIGTNANGTAALPQQHGIELDHASANIGTTITPGNNMISGNTTYAGIDIFASTGTTIYGNFIGPGAGGAAIPNNIGIRLSTGASATIGNNRIAYSIVDGVLLDSTSTVTSGSTYNCFALNNVYGVENLNTVSPDAPFDTNWWGNVTGPSHSLNPSGKGDAVTDHVNYSGFLTTPPSTCPGTNVTVSIAGSLSGMYFVPNGGSILPQYFGVWNGPVKVHGTAGLNVLSSERTVYGSSFHEIMGFPGSQLTTEYWFPWYDGGVHMNTWVMIANPDPSLTALVDVYIAGVKQNSVSYSIPHGGSILPQYFGVWNGPVQVVSTNGVNIIASERSIYGGSFNEVMGYPGNQLTTQYWFPWYDGGVHMNTWVMIANPDPSLTALVDVYIGGVKQNSTSYSIPHGGSILPEYFGLWSGPVQVVSTNGVNIIASERSIYGGSFNEVMGYPGNQLTTEYVFPWYDGGVHMNTWVMIANADPSATAFVDVYIAGVKQNSVPYSIPAGGSILPEYFGVWNGPVRVVSTTPINIMASERAIYSGSFNETMGFPANKLTTDYWFPWYDGGVHMNTWVMIAKP